VVGAGAGLGVGEGAGGKPAIVTSCISITHLSWKTGSIICSNFFNNPLFP
jgi:hypothetical protein